MVSADMRRVRRPRFTNALHERADLALTVVVVVVRPLRAELGVEGHGLSQLREEAMVGPGIVLVRALSNEDDAVAETTLLLARMTGRFERERSEKDVESARRDGVAS